MRIEEVEIDIFADGADIQSIKRLNKNPLVKGFTTNPTLMKKSGVTNYEAFAKEVLEIIEGKPVSFEVFADDFDAMEAQARVISSWGDNIFVKIPVTNTKGESSEKVITRLTLDGIKVNVTAVFTERQVSIIDRALWWETESIISVFCGRIADAGVVSTRMNKHLTSKKVKLLWASPRQLYDIVAAYLQEYHIITVSPDILDKVHLLGKDLQEFSLDTVKMFRKDAIAAGYKIEV